MYFCAVLNAYKMRISVGQAMHMIWTNKLSIFYIVIFSIGTLTVSAQKTSVLLYGPNDNGSTYTSLEEALTEPQKVYRLKLTKLPERDSLPEDLFKLTELRELTVKGCRLCVVNQRIGELTKLQYLNLDRNKLLRLPETIGQLTDLRFLIISRNLLETFPNSISNLKRLSSIDAWDNPLYVLPESISSLENSLKTLDLRQIPLTKSEYEAMERLLPKTEILFTDICECENRRDHE